MPITLAQSVSTPGNVTPGGTIQPADVSTLYSALGSFSASDLLFGLILAQTATDDTEYSVAAGATRDWTVAPPTGASAPTAANSLVVLLPFAWSGASASPTVRLRVNATEVTTAADMSFTNAGTGSGLMVALVAGHDATYARSVIFLGMDTGTSGGLEAACATVDVPNAAITSVGVAVAGTGVTMTFKRIRIWRLN